MSGDPIGARHGDTPEADGDGGSNPPTSPLASEVDMGRAGITLLALALLVTLVACGSERKAKKHAVTAVAHVRVPRPPAAQTASWVHVTVVDGDRGKPRFAR